MHDIQQTPMNDDRIARLRAQIGGPRDGSLLRFSLGTALLASGDLNAAVAALREAVEFDAGYSAAWKLLGQALGESGDTAGAIAAYQRGIETAHARGDRQAEKEMTVFLRRLQKSAAS
jgi:predicted Zn-dependent protease